MFPFYIEFGRWISHVRDKKTLVRVLCLVFFLVPGALLALPWDQSPFAICWDSKPRSISEIVCSSMTSAKRSTKRLEPFKQKWWWIFLEGISICFHFGFYLRINQKQTQPPTPPTNPTIEENAHRKFLEIRVVRQNAWELGRRSKSCLEPWWHPATTTAAIAGVFCWREEDCLLQTCYWNVRLDIWRFELSYCRCLKTFYFFEFYSTCDVVLFVSLDLSKYQLSPGWTLVIPKVGRLQHFTGDKFLVFLGILSLMVGQPNGVPRDLW